MLLATDSVTLNIIIFVVGLGILIKGSDWFVDAAAYIAHHYKIPDIIIGLTLVSVGTSLPELATNIYASSNGEGGIVLGNVVGSNITNICLVLGVGVICSGSNGMNICSRVFKRDGMVMLGIFCIYALLSYGVDGTDVLTRQDGVIMLILGAAYTIYLLMTSPKEEIEAEAEHGELAFKSLGTSMLFLVLGMTMVSFGAKIIVDTVVKTATEFNISKGVIAATVVAFGTSVPELAVTITSVMKKNNDLALGNILGSCIFNLVLVLSISTVVAPITMPLEMLNVVNPMMLVSGFVLIVAMKTGWKLVRSEGIILLLLYAAFIAYNIHNISL